MTLDPLMASRLLFLQLLDEAARANSLIVDTSCERDQLQDAIDNLATLQQDAAHHARYAAILDAHQVRLPDHPAVSSRRHCEKQPNAV